MSKRRRTPPSCLSFLWSLQAYILPVRYAARRALCSLQAHHLPIRRAARRAACAAHGPAMPSGSSRTEQLHSEKRAPAAGIATGLSLLMILVMVVVMVVVVVIRFSFISFRPLRLSVRSEHDIFAIFSEIEIPSIYSTIGIKFRLQLA